MANAWRIPEFIFSGAAILTGLFALIYTPKFEPGTRTPEEIAAFEKYKVKKRMRLMCLTLLLLAALVLIDAFFG